MKDCFYSRIMRGATLLVTVCGIFAGLPTVAGAGPLELVTTVPVERARQIAFHDKKAWVAQNFLGATLLDVSDPRAPSIIKQFPPEVMQPLYLRVLPEENLMLSADRFQGLVIYDISQAESPTTVSVTPLAPMTTHLDVAMTTSGKRMALLGRAGEGVLCVDISDPAAPVVTDKFEMGVEFTRSVCVADGIVYAADSREGGLKALRLVDPGRLEPLYQANLFGVCTHLAVHGNLLLASYDQYGFRIFELPEDGNIDTTPTLTLISTLLRNRSQARALKAVGDKLVVANGEIGVDLFHASNPRLPSLDDEYLFRWRGPIAHDCSVYENTIYVPAWDAGVLVFRITDAPSPAEFNLENI